jgi:DNA-binding transcriptional LysR family regulator
MTFDGRIISNVGVLAAIVEGGSFVRAADALGLSRSGVSRALSRLEARVGVRLVNRTPRAVALTDEGKRFYDEIAPMLASIEDTVTLASGSSELVRGRLRVNVDPFFSRLLFAPFIAEFLSLYPDLSLEFIAKDHLGDLVGEGFDMALRFGTPPESSLVARKLLETRMITVASSAYLKAHGTPLSPAELANHTCIKVRDSLTGQPVEEWQFQQGDHAVSVNIGGRLTVVEFGSMLGACLGGFGIARVKRIGVQRLVQEGSLVEVLRDWHGESHPLYALYPSRQLLAAKVRALVDFIQSHVKSGDQVIADSGQLKTYLRRSR